jgi:hypothetical protein
LSSQPIAQASAAIAVAIFAWRLVRFTRDYVEQMKLANELQAVANARQASLREDAEASMAPNLIATSGAGSFSGEDADIRWGVRNVGGSVASSIELRTPIGDVSLPTPLGPGESTTAQLRLRRDDLPVADTIPNVDEIAFTDPRGNEWLQRPGERPRRIL